MRVTACLAGMVLATAIVASAQTPPAAPAAGVACSLLTKDDAAAALGEAVTGPRATSMPEASSCEYSGSGIHKVTLNVFPLTAANSAMYKAMCAQKGKEGLTGLGDVTCWYNEKHGELQVMKGLTFFSIELRKSGDPTEAIKAVARKAYDRVK
jgi:hypothetical protein